MSMNFKYLFSDTDNESIKRDKNFFELVEKKDNDKREFVNNVKNTYMEKNRIYSCIYEFTKKTNSDEKKHELIDQLKELGCIKGITSTNSALRIETTEETIKAMKLSDFLPKIKEEYPDIETDDRKNKGYERTRKISKMLGIPNKVVTGYIDYTLDKSRYLHSWIEINIEGQEFVVDNRMNAVIDKKGYYMINHAKPLSGVPDEDVLRDLSKESRLFEKER